MSPVRFVVVRKATNRPSPEIAGRAVLTVGSATTSVVVLPVRSRTKARSRLPAPASPGTVRLVARVSKATRLPSSDIETSLTAAFAAAPAAPSARLASTVAPVESVRTKACVFPPVASAVRLVARERNATIDPSGATAPSGWLFSVEAALPDAPPAPSARETSTTSSAAARTSGATPRTSSAAAEATTQPLRIPASYTPTSMTCDPYHREREQCKALS